MKVPYTNNTAKFVHVGGVTIPPFDTREIDERLHPDYRPPVAPAAETPVSEMAVILAGSVATIVKGFDALADEELAELRAMEAGAEKPRSTLLKEIDEEVLTRAAKAAAGEQGKPGEQGAGSGG